MKINDMVKLSFKKFKCNKKITFINIFIISISCLLILIAYTLFDTLNIYISNNINKNIEYRTVFVKYNPSISSIEEVISDTEKIEHVDKVFRQEDYQVYVTVEDFITSKTDGNIRINAGDYNVFPVVVFGGKIENNEDNLIICPLKLIADSGVEGRKDLYEEDYIDMRQYLNKELNLTYYSYDYSTEIPTRNIKYDDKYKLIGLYDSNNILANENVCYISYNKVHDINKLVYQQVYNNFYTELYYHPLAIVDDSNNVDSVISDLSALGYTASKKLNIDTKLSNTIVVITMLLILVVSFISIMFIYMYVKKNLKDEREEIGIFKALGFSSEHILKLKWVELFIIMLIGFLFSLIFYIIIYMLVNYTICNGSIMWSKFTINFQLNLILLLLLSIFIIVTFIILNFSNKYKSIQAIDILKNQREDII